MVYNRRIDGVATRFALTGFLNNDNIVLYDEGSEQWWQQYDGMGLTGDANGRTLTALRSHVTSYADFLDEHGNDNATILLSTSLSRKPLAAGTAPVVLNADGLPLGVAAKNVW